MGVRAMIERISFWVVTLTLLTAGILKLVNPSVYLPTQSFLPITSEWILYVSALPLSVIEISLALAIILRNKSEFLIKSGVILFVIYFIWSFVVYIVGFEVPNSCIKRMADTQDINKLLIKNFILLTLSVFAFKQIIFNNWR